MIRWFTLHPIAANIVMAFIIVIGFFAVSAVKTEVIPAVDVDWLRVSIPFPGMPSKAIERQGVKILESQIRGLKGVDEVNTRLYQGLAELEVMLSPGSTALQLSIKSDVRALLDTIDQPRGAAAPSVFQVKIEPAVAALAIAGPQSYRDLESLAQQLKRQLEVLPAVGGINTYHGSERETTIVLQPNALAAAGLTAQQVAQVLRQSRQVFDVGRMEELGTSYRLMGQRDGDISEAGVGNPVLRQFSNGVEVRLDDVATLIEPAFDRGHRFNGQRAVLLAVKSAPNAGLVELSDSLNNFIDEAQPGLPKGVKLDIWQDTSKYFKARTQLLIENGFYGFVLLFIVLALALHWRLAFWVSFGLPVAFLGGFLVLWATGYSVNMVSLFAFILVLGVLVDDAIIVGDSVHHAQREWAVRWGDGYQNNIVEAQRALDHAVVQSVMNVAKPVVVAALTTMIMFVPLLFLPGDEGRMLRGIPLVVVATLFFSLIESLLILPAHLRTRPARIPKKKEHTALFRFRQRLSEKMSKVVHWNCENPWTTQAFFIGMLCILCAVLISGRLHYSFFAKIEGDMAVAMVTMAEGATQEQLDDVLDRLEYAALELQSRNKKDFNLPKIKHVLRKHLKSGASAQRTGQVAIEMSTAGSRETPAEVVAREWRQRVNLPSNVESLQIQTSLNPSRHRVEFYLQAHERAPLEAAAQALGNWLQTQSGVARVILDGAALEPQVIMKVNSVGQGLNISLQDISQQVRSVMSEETLFDLQTSAGPSPVKLRMSSPEGVQSLDELARLPLRTHQGTLVTLGDIATLSVIQKPLTLSRTAGQPSVKVTIEKNAKDAHWSHGDWRGHIQKILRQYYPEVRFVSGLYQQEQAEIETYLLVSFVLALVCMYGLMSVLLRSYWLPLIILYAVPFGLVGAIIGHWVLDMSFTLYSLIGAFAVSGIVVNDNLVLLDQFEQKRKHMRFQPMMGKMAIVAAVKQRARAVILTTVTTVLGMLPLILESSIQSQFLKPMAVSLAFGISTATFVTLFLVPATLALFNNKKLEQADLIN